MSSRFSIRMLSVLVGAVALLAPAPTRAAITNLETFSDHWLTNSYEDIVYYSTDCEGVIWDIVNCKGEPPVDGPAICLDRDTTAYVATYEPVPGGCGSLAFDWQAAGRMPVALDILVNGVLRHTIGSTNTDTNTLHHAGPLEINQGGNFTLRFQQHDASSRQVAIDNIAWTSFENAPPSPPRLFFEPPRDDFAVQTETEATFIVGVFEDNLDPVRLWADPLPEGASFPEVNGTAPLTNTFSWIPTAAQTGGWNVVFFAADADGTNSLTMHIEVRADDPYYYAAEGLTGPPLRAALHQIVSDGFYPLSDSELNTAMPDIHTAPGDENSIYCIYTCSTLPKSSYDTDPLRWNKEHCWPKSRGLSSPADTDLHNLYGTRSTINALRGNLLFDESDPTDPAFSNLTTLVSLDSDSFEPPASSKGNVARAAFYMSIRYDGSGDGNIALDLADAVGPSEDRMGVLSTLLAWNRADPPDAWERDRNDAIFYWQENRNPFVDHPGWVEKIWGTNNLPPTWIPALPPRGTCGQLLTFPLSATPTPSFDPDPVTLSMASAPDGALFERNGANGVFSWTPPSAGTFSVTFLATDIDGVATQTVSLTVAAPAQPIPLVEYDFTEGNVPAFAQAPLTASPLTTFDASFTTNATGNPGNCLFDAHWQGTTNFFAFSIAIPASTRLVWTGLTFDDKASSSGPKKWHIRSSIDAFLATNAAGSTHTDFKTNSASFTATALPLSATNLTIRLYGTDATGAAGTWRIDNLHLVGYLLPVSDYALWAAEHGITDPSGSNASGVSHMETYLREINTNAPIQHTGTLNGAPVYSHLDGTSHGIESTIQVTSSLTPPDWRSPTPAELILLSPAPPTYQLPLPTPLFLRLRLAPGN